MAKPGEFVEQLARGDPAAWARWYDDTSDRLFHYLLVQTNSRHAAGDVIQEAFLRLYKRRVSLLEVNDLEAYLFTVVRNEGHRHREKHVRDPLSLTSIEQAAREWFVVMPDTTLETSELTATALLSLSDSQREVVQLKFFADLTFVQIAEICQTPLGTVTSRYRQAMKHIKQFVKERADA